MRKGKGRERERVRGEGREKLQEKEKRADGVSSWEFWVQNWNDYQTGAGIQAGNPNQVLWHE